MIFGMREKISYSIFLLALCYGPWHGATTMGVRIPLNLPVPVLQNLTVDGLINIVFVCAVFLSCGFLQWSNRKRLKLDYRDGLFVALPLLFLFNSYLIDKYTLVSLENIFLLSMLLFSIKHSAAFSFIPDQIRGVALVLWVASYGLSLFLPLMIPRYDPSGSVHAIWTDPTYTMRYVGWAEGTPFALIGLAIFIAGWVSVRKRWMGPGWLLIFLGYIGVFLNVHRISLVALFSVSFWMILQSIRDKNRVRLKAALAVCLLLIGTGLSGNFYKKTTISKSYMQKDLWKQDIVVHPDDMQDTLDHGIWKKPDGTFKIFRSKYDGLVSSNGRVALFNYLMLKSEGSRIFGKGTGFAPRELEEFKKMDENMMLSEPQSDYLRFFVDHGCVGLILLLAMFASVLFSSIELHGRLAVLGLMVAMLTENMFVFPSTGYGPLLVSGLLLSRPR